MPEYSYECDHCKLKFTKRMSMEDYLPDPCCPKCERFMHVHRDYAADGVNFLPPQHTLGSLADKNSSHMSNDHKTVLYNKHNDYKKGFKREARSN